MNSDDADDLRAAAGTWPEPFRLVLRERCTSTNDEARQLASQGAPDGWTVLALEQTHGRGRRGAAWFSPAGGALAFTIVLRPPEPKALWPRLALAAGVAVAEAIEGFTAEVGIKWPNDVWVGGKKIAGILVESGADFALVGIGVNIGARNFPPDLADLATSLALAGATGVARCEVLTAMIGRFAVRRRQIDGDLPDLLDAVRCRCVLSGRRISYTDALEREKIAHVEGIGPGGELRVLSDDGYREGLLQADLIRILPSGGGDDFNRRIPAP